MHLRRRPVMNKSVRAFLALVIGAALAVMILLFQHMLDIRREVSSVTLQLEESVSSWKKINEDKEALQDTLKAAREELREAELTISECEIREKELIAEIEALEAELVSLRSP